MTTANRPKIKAHEIETHQINEQNRVCFLSRVSAAEQSRGESDSTDGQLHPPALQQYHAQSSPAPNSAVASVHLTPWWETAPGP